MRFRADGRDQSNQRRNNSRAPPRLSTPSFHVKQRPSKPAAQDRLAAPASEAVATSVWLRSFSSTNAGPCDRRRRLPAFSRTHSNADTSHGGTQQLVAAASSWCGDLVVRLSPQCLQLIRRSTGDRGSAQPASSAASRRTRHLRHLTVSTGPSAGHHHRLDPHPGEGHTSCPPRTSCASASPAGS
jgi:hypothetical protein